MSMSKFASVEARNQAITPSDDLKPIVQYRREDLTPPVVGGRFTVYPIDHPDRELNGRQCTTSVVQSVYGFSFETKNTRYVLAD